MKSPSIENEVQNTGYATGACVVITMFNIDEVLCISPNDGEEAESWTCTPRVVACHYADVRFQRAGLPPL